jgi:hypothetical protein
MQSIRPVRVNHMNIVWESFDASVEHLTSLYGATIVMDIPPTTMHAGLFEIGRVLFEFFTPHEYLLASRYGPHYLGIEYDADMTVVRQAIAERGIRIVRDTGIALHTHPADGFGISFEFYDGYFHDWVWEEKGGTSLRSAAYWRDEHPLSLLGQKGYTVAVHDIEAATAFYQSFLSAEIVYDIHRPEHAARAIGLKTGDVVAELLTPTGPGTIQAHLRDHGQGIRSTIFRARDIGVARRYFEARGIELEPGTAPEAFSVPAKANLGVIFEFQE